jgi:hypothetical protein
VLAHCLILYLIKKDLYIMATINNAVTTYDIIALGEIIGDAIVNTGLHEAHAVAGKTTLKCVILDSILELRGYHVSQAGEQQASYIAGCIALFGDGIYNAKNYVAGSVRQSVEAALTERKKAHYNSFMKARGITAKKRPTESDLIAYTQAATGLDFEADKVISGLKSALMRARMIYRAAWSCPSIMTDDKGLYRGLNTIYADASELIKNKTITAKPTAQTSTDKGANVPSGKAANNREAFEMLMASESPATVLAWLIDLLAVEPAYAKKHALQLKTLEALKAQL